ncbi:MAG TPA: insulinase family protein [Candidatus Acidoferrales bacterium]|nr:insulinase family protein [Candidatus Acidoferrales bacterium]
MKRIHPGLTTLSLLGLLLLLAAGPAAAQKNYKELAYPPLHDIHLPKVERAELPNGLVVYLVEDHTLPKVEGYALIKTGDRFEPADKVGLASLLGQAMRTGGTTTRGGEEIDRLLENTGASVETAIGTESATASLFALKEDLPLVVEILADLLQNPALPQDKIDLALVQERSAIARRNDNVIAVASREFSKLLYGPDSPYARSPEYETLQSISRDDLVAFHRRYFHPNQTILGLWGDFDPVAAKALVERAFGAWPRQEVPPPSLPAVSAAATGSVNFIQKDDVNQTNLRIGHLGGRLDDPDYYALNVMAEILGGGSSSRLYRHIRTDLGLAYAVGASWNPAYDHTGSFLLYCNTKSESTVRAIRESMQEVRRITEEPVSDEELRVAKEGILNSFVFNFDTTGEIVRRLMTYEYYGYPRDFLERFKANIEKVTAEDVLRAAAAHVRPDQLVILAVGRQQDFDQPLMVLGDVNTIDITIPEPKAAAEVVPEATPESQARGREVLQAAISGLGGLEALESVSNLSVLSEMTQLTPQGEMTLNTKSVLQLPDKARTDIVTPFGAFTMVYDAGTGWMKTPQGVQDLPPAQMQELRKAVSRHPIVLLVEALKAERPVQFLESTTVEGREVDAILVPDASGESVKLYVDKETGRILKRSFRALSPQGAVEQDQIFSDFRPVGALAMAFKEVTYQNGEKMGERTVKNVEVNVALDPAVFAREETKPE